MFVFVHVIMSFHVSLFPFEVATAPARPGSSWRRCRSAPWAAMSQGARYGGEKQCWKVECWRPHLSPGLRQWRQDLQLRVRAEAGWLLPGEEAGPELRVRNAEDRGDHHHDHDQYDCHYHHQVSYPGACREPCAGMESLGQFQAFGSPATNYGEIEKWRKLFRTIYASYVVTFQMPFLITAQVQIPTEIQIVPILRDLVRSCQSYPSFNCQASVFTISSGARQCCGAGAWSTRGPRPAVRQDLTSASESEILFCSKEILQIKYQTLDAWLTSHNYLP